MADVPLLTPDGHDARDHTGVPGVGDGSGGGLTLIDSITRASDGPIVFSSIPNTYKHLELIARVRSVAVASSAPCDLRMGNGSVDTGSNYSYMRRRVGVTDSEDSSTTADLILGPNTIGASMTANYFSVVRFLILDYAVSSHWREVEFRGGTPILPTSAHGNGVWRNAAAVVDTVSLVTGGNDWLAGSQAWLYGHP